MVNLYQFTSFFILSKLLEPDKYFYGYHRDKRIVTNDVRSDIDLLFSEVETVKRKTNKLKKSILK